MTILARSLHTTDEQLDGRELRRTIRNFANYRTPAGLWLPSVPGLRERETGLGSRGFRLAQVDAPLQAFVSDGAALGLRDSRSLDRWATLAPAGTDPRSRPVVEGEHVTWPGLWRRCDLRWTVHANRVEKLITLASPGHPEAFRFYLDLGPGQRALVVAGRMLVGDDRGSWLWTQPAWAADARGRPVRVGVRLDGTTLVIEPSADDLRAAAYPVRVDPTATISGTTNVEDTCLRSTYTSQNFGGATMLFCGMSGGQTWRPLIRIVTASLPTGSITGFRWLYTIVSLPTASDTLDCHRVGARAWVEGTANGADQPGSVTWRAVIDNTVAWTTAGCDSSGNDYLADASPPGYAYTATSPTGLATVTLRSSWVSDWRDGVIANNGFRMSARASNAGGRFAFNSTENATTPPYVEIDYSTGPAAPVLAYLRRRMRS